MIEVKQDLDSLSYDTGIEIKVISKNFDYPEKFGKLTSSQLDAIMMTDSTLNKENILIAFLYINSYIGCRSKKDDGSEYDNAKDYPEAFWKSIESVKRTVYVKRYHQSMYQSFDDFNRKQSCSSYKKRSG